MDSAMEAAIAALVGSMSETWGALVSPRTPDEAEAYHGRPGEHGWYRVDGLFCIREHAQAAVQAYLAAKEAELAEDLNWLEGKFCYLSDLVENSFAVTESDGENCREERDTALRILGAIRAMIAARPREEDK